MRGEGEGESVVTLSNGVVCVSSSWCEEGGELIKLLKGGDKDSVPYSRRKHNRSLSLLIVISSESIHSIGTDGEGIFCPKSSVSGIQSLCLLIIVKLSHRSLEISLDKLCIVVKSALCTTWNCGVVEPVVLFNDKLTVEEITSSRSLFPFWDLLAVL